MKNINSPISEEHIKNSVPLSLLILPLFNDALEPVEDSVK
jgi:hypothetical protein